jgi:hypothetical protein
MEQTHTWIRKDDYAKLKEIMSSTGQTSLCETLHNIINNGKQDQKGLTLLNLRDGDFSKLKRMQEDLSFSDLGAVIHHIIESQTSLEIITIQKIMRNDCPVCLTGKPFLSGKTFWVMHSLLGLESHARELTKAESIQQNPVLVIDTNSEYTPLREIKSIRELDLCRNEQVRFCPQQHSLMSLMQVKALFTELNMIVDMNKEALKNLVLIVEEAQSYKSSWFNGFLYKSRHLLRKMIVVTPQTDCFLGLETYTIFH